MSNKDIDNSNNTIEDIKNIFYNVFSTSNIILIIWFLAIYLVSYFFLGFIFPSNSNEVNLSQQINLSRTLDIIIFIFVFIYLLFYFSMNKLDEKLLKKWAIKYNEFLNEPSSIFTTSGSIIVFYFIVYLFRIPMTYQTKSIFVSIFENFLLITLLIIVFIDFFKYVLNYDISKMFDNLLDIKYDKLIYYENNDIDLSNIIGNTHIDGNTHIIGNTHISSPEVFNISNNLYTYDDAQAICKSYDAKLATYKQVEDAYNNGGEWCNYGWSDGQMALFPTQYATWEELQKSEKTKNNCGRPGVNGGYMENPNIKFGVNCYGIKPKPDNDDLARLTAKRHNIVPKTDEELELEKKVKCWKENSNKLLQINSYNNYKWSEK